MKKIVIILLITLPIFLMLSISFAGKIIENWRIVSVESVSFIDDSGAHITELEISKGRQYDLKIEILPLNATNQKVTFSIIAGNVCTLEENVLTTLDYGFVEIVSTTDDGYFQSRLHVSVVDLDVESISLNYDQLSLKVGENKQLEASVLPKTAIERRVIWKSSDTTRATVNASGVINALLPTLADKPVIITATTVDGGYIASCELTIENELPDIAFYRLDESNPVPYGEVIVVTEETIDLLKYIRFGNTDAEGGIVAFTVTNDNCRLDGNMLTLLKAGVSIRINVVVEYQKNGQTITFNASGTFRKK